MGLGPAEVVIAALKRYAARRVSDLCLRFVGESARPLEAVHREVFARFSR